MAMIVVAGVFGLWSIFWGVLTFGGAGQFSSTIFLIL
jgi:hypothetical protein